MFQAPGTLPESKTLKLETAEVRDDEVGVAVPIEVADHEAPRDASDRGIRAGHEMAVLVQAEDSQVSRRVGGIREAHGQFRPAFAVQVDGRSRENRAVERDADRRVESSVGVSPPRRDPMGGPIDASHAGDAPRAFPRWEIDIAGLTSLPAVSVPSRTATTPRTAGAPVHVEVGEALAGLIAAEHCRNRNRTLPDRHGFVRIGLAAPE